MIVVNPLCSDVPMNSYTTSCADLAKALAHPHRLSLLNLVGDMEQSVEQLANASGLSFANTSQHLQQLKRLGLVQVRRDGKRVLYTLGEGPVQELLQALIAVVDHRQDQVRRLTSSAGGAEAISISELMERMKNGSVVLLDVRPGDEFAAGHLPGAINMEIGNLSAWLDELPGRTEVVAYCRGALCMLSADAVALLRARGHSACRLDGGVSDWSANGYPLEHQ